MMKSGKYRSIRRPFVVHLSESTLIVSPLTGFGHISCAEVENENIHTCMVVQKGKVTLNGKDDCPGITLIRPVLLFHDE